ncbi:MAG: ABC transporter permease [Deltaproteobacteria bacterium]|nr:ABC transporter permease [Deltaproteobacteria bacterium]MBW2361876.1 ABC transporter permease [Deltaproteobacteria bacterium]
MSARPQTYFGRVWAELRTQQRAVWGLRIVVTLAVVALFADFIASDKPLYMQLEGLTYFPLFREYGVQLGWMRWQPELLNADFAALNRVADRALWPPIPYASTAVDLTGEVFAIPSAQHWLGTDALGRDVAAGMVHGTRVSLTIGLVVVAIQASIGILLGGVAGYYGGWVDVALSRIFELMLGIPTFFLIITVAAIFPPSIYVIMAILGLTGWVGIARFIRGEFLKVRSQDFVTAARSLGVSDARVMFRHILPNAVAPVLVSMAFGVASAILLESGLSFLGIGVPQHLVTWGSILAESRASTFAWWLAVFPGAAIFVTVTAYNLLGDGLRDALDPKLDVH